MYSGIVNGEATTFGTSGLLYRSNKVMYDRATRSLWNQFIGEPVIGPLADSGIRQPFFPSVVTTWEEWLEEPRTPQCWTVTPTFTHPTFRSLRKTRAQSTTTISPRTR